MKNLSKLLAITIFLVFGLFTAITSFPNQLDAAPPGNPPLANISPIFTGLKITGDTILQGNTTLGDAATDNIYIAGTLKHGHPQTKVNIADPVDITGALKVTQNLTVDGDTTLGNAATDTVTIPGTTTSNRINLGVVQANPADYDTKEPLWVYGMSRLFGTVVASRDVQVNRNLTVTGTTTSSGNLTANGQLTVKGHTNLGDNKSVDNLTIDSTIKTTTAPLELSANTRITGSLTVLGDISAYNYESSLSTGKFGSNYVNAAGFCVNYANKWVNIGPGGCYDSVDVITGCSGLFDHTDHAGDHFAGAFMGKDGKCYIRVKNYGGSGYTTGGCTSQRNAAYIMAHCFDPDGGRTQKYYGGGVLSQVSKSLFGHEQIPNYDAIP